MSKQYGLAACRFGFAIVVLAAIGTQFLHSQQVVPNFSAVNFFSFFTVESNLFGAVVFMAAAASAQRGMQTIHLHYLRGAATLYMVVTGIIYSLLLTGVDVQASVSWCNAVLHYIFPVVILVDWSIDRAPFRLKWGKALLWLIFPLVYAVYTLVRAPFAGHWYAYPFMNVSEHGYLTVLVNCALVAVAVMGLSGLLALISRLKFKAWTTR